MNLKNWKTSYHSMKSENGLSRLIIAALALSTVLLSIKAINQETKVIVQPWTMHTSGWIMEDNASQSYKEAWGLALAQMLGNVNPGNLKFISERLEPLLPIEATQDIMTALKAQIIQFQENRITTRFEPTKVMYEKSSGKVFVVGYYFTKAPGIKEKRTERTYEFLISMDSYLPQLFDIDTYEDEPRTHKRLAQLAKSKKSKRQEER